MGAACTTTSAPTTLSRPAKTVVLGGAVGSGTPAPAAPGKNVPAIKVDTVGYPSDWRKVVVFNVAPVNAVVVDDDDRVVLEITARHISEHGLDKASQDQVWQVDISEITAAGTYRLRSEGAESDPFAIGEDLYDRGVIAALKSFYFQRTRTALTKPYAVWEGDEYVRAKVSHAHKDVGWDVNDYPDKKRKWKPDAGWHDAGNFDMYVPSTAPSAQALLMAYEWEPQYFGDGTLNIPESGNGVPDILDEAKWGIRWVLSMQEDSGAFRHREAVLKWSPEGPADEDMSERWISGVSSAGTAKAIAVLAMAARVYADWDKEFAERCAAAAKRGWVFLSENPERIRVDGPESPQPKWDDEPGNSDVGARLIAAVQMWRSFRNRAALEQATELLSTKEAMPKELITGAWANLSRWGVGALAFDEGTPAKLRGLARERLLAAAEILLPRSETEDGYRCLSSLSDYYWAHNSNLLEKAHVMAMAAKLAPESPRYLQAARDQWHWILGRNPNGYSMITRVGKGPDRLYHMEWGHREPPPPGFLLGGPNADNMGFLAPGAPAKALLWDNPSPLRTGLKAHSLWHWKQSDLWDGGFVPDGEWKDGWWAVTEPDILYSANFVLAAVAVR